MNNSATECYLGPLLTDPSRIRREAVRRRKLFDEKSVSADTIPDHEAKGGRLTGSSSVSLKSGARRRSTKGWKTDYGCFCVNWATPR